MGDSLGNAWAGMAAVGAGVGLFADGSSEGEDPSNTLCQFYDFDYHDGEPER